MFFSYSLLICDLRNGDVAHKKYIYIYIKLIFTGFLLHAFAYAHITL